MHHCSLSRPFTLVISIDLDMGENVASFQNPEQSLEVVENFYRLVRDIMKKSMNNCSL